MPPRDFFESMLDFVFSLVAIVLWMVAQVFAAVATIATIQIAIVTYHTDFRLVRLSSPSGLELMVSPSIVEVYT
jgi:hypothetical protein